jgi:RpiB/LacA/LacB family sugar-phosphate isomerase
MKAITDWNKDDKRIGIAADHGGFELKKEISATLTAQGYEVLDYGPTVFDPLDDYSDFGVGLARAVSFGELERGILLCRSGVGMGICANRFHNVRGALCFNEIRFNQVKGKRNNAYMSNSVCS